MASRAQPVLWRETVKAGAVRSGALVAALVSGAYALRLMRNALVANTAR